LLPLAESDEPPVRYSLEHGGQHVSVRLDQPFELEVDGQKRRFTLRAEPNRLLDLPALRFEYPRHIPFEYETEDNYTCWTLDGNSATLLIQRVGSSDDPHAVLDDIVDSFKQGFGSDTRAHGPVALTLDGRELRGERLRVMIAGSLLDMEAFALCRRGGDVYLLILQDMLNDDGSTTDEMHEVRRILVETFRFQPD
jgi:hypothetical protein